MNVNNVGGSYNSYLLKHYARTDKRFPALCVLVKAWAKKAGINDARWNTLNRWDNDSRSNDLTLAVLRV